MHKINLAHLNFALFGLSEDHNVSILIGILQQTLLNWIGLVFGQGAAGADGH